MYYEERKENENLVDTCARCVSEYLKYANTTVFDYTKCTHCHISQKIHKEDSNLWNGYCRFLR